MKEATGEMNMTVVTIIAIGAIIAFFWFMWPQIRSAINGQWNGINDDQKNHAEPLTYNNELPEYIAL